MYGILILIHLMVAVMLIGLILIQQGKGSQAGAAFGSGASQTVFGSQGAGGFLSRATTYLAVIFFIVNLSLAYLVNKSVKAQTAPDATEASQPIQSLPTQPDEGDIPSAQ